MKNENSVAYIAKINNISPIEGADKIELVTVNGWSTTAQKGANKLDELVLCITTDAVIPQGLAEKWGVDKYLRKGNRVRTIKLKGIYSECILIPLHDVPGAVIKEGYDMMEILQIFKYEPPVNNHVGLGTGPKSRNRYHTNPNFHIYHKFPNQKNTPNMFSEEDEVVISRKIHGTNARYGIVRKPKLTFFDKIRKLFGNKWVEYDFVYGSHNVEKGSESQGFYNTDVWREVGEKYRIKEALWTYFKSQSPEIFETGIVLYGEIFGHGIQGEKYNYGLKDKQIKFFDVTSNGNYLPDYLWRPLIEHMGFSSNSTVEILYQGKWSKEIQNKYVVNQFIEGTKIPHEGIVVKHVSGSRDKVSKVINPDYLIFSEKHLVPDSH